jgi:hypothetical protein
MKNLFLSTLFLFGCWQASAQDYLQIAKTCFENGDYQTAKKNYEVYQIFEGKDMSAEIQKADECFKALIAANDYFSNKRYEEARERYKVVLEKNPKDPYAKKQYEICEEFILISQSKVQANVKDIITLKSGEDIQALVQEVGDVDVKYKRFDNPNGPNYTLKKSEIFSITYANGSKDVFADTAKPQEAKIEQSIQPSQAQDYYAGVPIVRVKRSEYIFEGTIKKMDDTELTAYLREYCPVAYRTFTAGLAKRKSGNNVCIFGSIFAIGGSIGMSLVDVDSPVFGYLAGFALGGCISIFTGAGIMASGNRKARSAIDEYNSHCANKNRTAATLNFGITRSGGIGLALNF